MKKWYRLYGKMSENERMKPVDWSSGVFVNNLIHATIFNENQANIALNEVKVLNPDVFKFELREVKELRGKDWC